MKTQNAELLTQILALVALLTQQGAYQVHADLDGASQVIRIRIYPLGARWIAGQPSPSPIATADAYWCKSHWRSYDPATHDQQIIDELLWLSLALHAYLQPPQQVAA